MEKNKTGKYLKYAIGEIVLVMIGILLALQINNWNERQKIEKKHQELILSLIEDFEFNVTELTDINIKENESQLETMNLFFESQNDSTYISLDSIKTLARSFMIYDNYSPNLTAFKEAQSTGSLSQLKNKFLLQEFTKFIQEYESFIKVGEQQAYTFFNGSTWEFRKTVEPGTIYNSIYAGSIAQNLSYSDYIKLINTPLAKNAFQNSYILTGNMQIHLSKLLEHAKNILNTLKKIKK